MFKDKDKQREANRQAARRHRLTAKGMTPDANVIPEPTPAVIPEQGVTDKALPAITKDDILSAAHKIINHRRRGKDITKFEHLPPDVQGTINRLSGDDTQEHARRTAIAIDYQHKQPDRYYSTGIA